MTTFTSFFGSPSSLGMTSFHSTSMKSMKTEKANMALLQVDQGTVGEFGAPLIPFTLGF